ncbi:hypothetical protein TCON_2061 [Astathelohania contejeani]|uniref:V-ATPase proteolipid subunit C-like domain-containing protein n=1 Tax=Astathelohania contejeani TaxID=164912 RepID=A0ABQ7HX83_9MICR|nr:hypothetical protein TCON_2061 [Thelohania contejeani]
MEFDNDFYYQLIKALALALGVIPAFIGVSWGITTLMPGACAAAEIKVMMGTTLFPLCFVSASVIFSLLLFFKERSTTINSYEDAFKMLTRCAISGVGSFCAAMGVGGVTRHTMITKVQQKNFGSQFLMTMVFPELVGLMGFVILFA